MLPWLSSFQCSTSCPGFVAGTYRTKLTAGNILAPTLIFHHLRKGLRNEPDIVIHKESVFQSPLKSVKLSPPTSPSTGLSP